MMLTKKFVRRPFYVDAVQVTEANIDDVAKWCGGDVRTNAIQGLSNKYVKVRVYRPLNDRQTQAFVGDWILYAGTGFKVYTAKAFDNSFVLSYTQEEIIKNNLDAFINDQPLPMDNVRDCESI